MWSITRWSIWSSTAAQDRRLHHDRLQPAAHRKTRIFGTRGEIYGDGERIELFDFLTDQTARDRYRHASDGLASSAGTAAAITA